MALDNPLAELMVDTIEVAPVTATNAYAKHTWGTDVELTGCRVESGSFKVLDPSGQEVVTSGRVFVPNAPAVTPEYRLTLPDGSSPKIVQVHKQTDERGSHHLVIYFGNG